MTRASAYRKRSTNPRQRLATGAGERRGPHLTLRNASGTSATTYSPADSVTREQMAAFLGRFIRSNA